MKLVLKYHCSYAKIFVVDGDLPTEMETSFIDPLPIPQNGLENGRDSSESALSKNEAGGEIISNGNINVNVSASRSSLENTPKSDAPLFSDIPVEDGSCYSDSENDQFRWDFKKQSRDNGRLRPASNLATLPMFLKRRKKKKRRGNTWSDHRATKVRCDCAFSGEDLCLIHTKSHSESDVATPFHRIGEDYLADLSDISVASFSLADDDSSSESYVDIDLHNLRKFLRDSDSVSQSERSLDLSSEWSELHRTMSEPSITDGYYSLAEECRESDIPDTASDFSQDSRTHTKKTRRLHYPRRLKRLPVMGHHVNESYLENECFCCHCSIM